MRPGSDLEQIFETQGLLQENIFGIHPGDMPDNMAVAYIAQMVLEATDELHEILGEMTGWKGHHKEKEVIINREQAGREARDVLQYVINIMLTCGWTANNLMKEYEDKVAVNFARVNGIGGEKCSQCKRGLDDPGAVANCPEQDCIQR